METNIIINGVSVTYQGDYDEMHNLNWNDIIRERLDEANAEEDGVSKFA
jgi:hypothetical protein